VNAGKLAGIATRVLRRGGGTALPGLVAERIDPRLVANLGRSLGGGRVLITGTNGKTTTSRMVAEALDSAGRPFVHNREGSNLMRGIASTLLEASGALGSIRVASEAIGLFETDEATLPAAADALRPKAIAFTNLFRDQLDRYGEVDSVAALWRSALANTPPDATLILNADDPSVAQLADGWSGPVHWFGLDDPAFATTTGGAFDARWCACGGNYAYERRYFAHVGFWRCTRCDRKRPTPDTVGRAVRPSVERATVAIDGLGELNLGVTGLYNVYNALAAAAMCRVLGLSAEDTRVGLERVEPAFGRQEVVDLEGRKLRLFLAKNPAGANQVLLLWRHIAGERGQLQVVTCLNDRFADGRDVSWIWDVDFEAVSGHVEQWWAGGDRAEDLAVRLKYAGWPRPGKVSHEAASVLDAVLAGTEAGTDVFVLPTYTAMLDLREELLRRGAVKGRME